jgi:ribonuclease D
MVANYQIIETLAELAPLVRILEKEDTIGVDLEADSMYHFQEKVCLLQLSTKRNNIIVDTLQIQDLALLQPLFADRHIKKIFHGADYDIRSLYRDFKIEINHLFDTQLASMFLGAKETGLEAVLQKRFNANLDKKYQRKDWSKRPLPGDMIAYAANDVHYLVPLAQILEKELKEKGRLRWVHEECEYLSRVRPAQNNQKPLYLNFKGAGRLQPKSLAVLEALLKYRMKIAKKKDKPLFKIFRNQALMPLATKIPTTLKHLAKIKILSRTQIEMYGKELLATINSALSIPDKKLPVYPHKKAPVLEPAVPKRLKALKAWRDATAKALEFDPTILLNKALLNLIAIQNPTDIKSLNKIKEMKKWQKSEFGKDIVNILKQRNRQQFPNPKL